MRTTITLDDELLRRAKLEALERGTTLSRIVADALTADLGRVGSPAEPFEMITYGGGDPLPGVDINDNRALRDVLDEDGRWTSSM